MKKNELKVTIECEICKNRANSKDVLIFSRYCDNCKEREFYYFCSDGCFAHFIEHIRRMK
jgi:hypothetical protein